MDRTQLTQNEWLEVAGLGHVSEIADADTPHTPRGCPFQAWSLAEFLRLDRVVLAAETAPKNSHPDLLR
jgi:glycogen debranching enzyme